uniref:Putative galactofuranosyltransferase n=1 Tax=Angomonas deanei TaxID=59799 RepID=C6K3M7_9TRYP|nr:putative galactofuranosyltransferase [Angomonas deanei]
MAKSKTSVSRRRRHCCALGFLVAVVLVGFISINVSLPSFLIDDPAQLPPVVYRNARFKTEDMENPYFNENLTRPGEPYISFDAYLDCLAQRLNVDRHTKQELPFAQWNTTMPYLVVPVTVEQGDMKALACNMSVAVRHLTYVQNGGVGSMTAFLDGVAAAFAFTRRLKVVRMPHNFGYSVALNVAMRDALSMPFEEVPFLMMGNNDVRFPAGMLEAGMPQMYAQSLAGRARVAELEAEVATEPNEHTPPRFRDVPLRSTDGRHVLVTSRLLPDRIRYMSKDERRNAFKDYYGQLYVDHNTQTAFWGLTRLAMEVTGYFDENCYPAYYEDTDYLRRLWLLGFKALYIRGYEGNGMRHIGGGSVMGVQGFRPAARLRDVVSFIKAATYVIHRLYSSEYMAEKYNSSSRTWSEWERNEPFPRERLPLDAFVVNEGRNLAITELQRTAVQYYSVMSPRARFAVSTPAQLMERQNATMMAFFGSYMHKFSGYYSDKGKLRVRPLVEGSLKISSFTAAASAFTTQPTLADKKPYFDENLTRPGEPYISFDAYLDCLAQRLNVDRHTKQELPFAQWNTTMPYLVVPVTVEQGDMKALACNMSVAVRHLTYVQNGGVGSMTAFLDGVAAAFAFTRRLKVVRMPHNFGYSVALNVAMRDALSLPFEEVPFLMMGNNDVRFPAGMLEAGMPQMYAQSLAGRARVAELEAEVATEPNEHTPPRFRDVPLRSTDGRHVLVTSRLLPDRIRYMSKDERRNAFKDFAGPLYVDHNVETAFWGLTRLAMEVTGYFDENCYPAYYEDTDYVRRMWLLGFQSFHVRGFERRPMRHIGGGSVVGVGKFKPAPHLSDIPPFIRASAYIVKIAFPYHYTMAKYELPNIGWPDAMKKEPYRSQHFPLDAYVLNERRNAAITELQHLAIEFQTISSAKTIFGAASPEDALQRRNKTVFKNLRMVALDYVLYYRDGDKLRVALSRVNSTVAA